MGCVLVMHVCQLCVCVLCCDTMCFLHLHGVDNGCNDVSMWKLMLLLWSEVSWVYDWLHVVKCHLHVLVLYAWLHVATCCYKCCSFMLDYMCLCVSVVHGYACVFPAYVMVYFLHLWLCIFHVHWYGWFHHAWGHGMRGWHGHASVTSL